MSLAFVPITGTQSILDSDCKSIKIPFLLAEEKSLIAELWEYFTEKYGAYFAEPVFSSDNAAGIAILTEKAYLQGANEFDFSNDKDIAKKEYEKLYNNRKMYRLHIVCKTMSCKCH